METMLILKNKSYYAVNCDSLTVNTKENTVTINGGKYDKYIVDSCGGACAYSCVNEDKEFYRDVIYGRQYKRCFIHLPGQKRILIDVFTKDDIIK